MGIGARRRAVAARIVVVAAMVAAVLGGGGPVGPTAAAAGSWDPRVADLVAAVERLRGLEFERPVSVDVLGDDAFERRLLRGGAPTRRDRREWEEVQDTFIALDLQDERVDLETVQRASGSNVVGFYDSDRQAIVLRGSRLDDPGTRATLVHELTHALQDQHFDLDRLQRRASRADSLFTDALIEGDATEVEQRYYESLTPAEREEATQSAGEMLDEAEPLPPFLEAVFYAPYALGLETARTLRAIGGRRRLDDVMRRPPTRDLGLVDPTALEGAAEWEAVDVPPLDAGDVQRGDPFPMDAVGLYLVLAQRLGWNAALSISERWGGDQAVTFTRAGHPCVRMRVAGRDGESDAVVIADGFRRWAALGSTEATVVEDERYAEVTLCDQGDGADVAPGAPAQAILGLSLRNEAVASFVDSGVGLNVAKCAADGLVALPEAAAVVASVQSLADDIPESLTSDLRAAVADNVATIAAGCRVAV